jgi:hypothetical protein
MQLKKRYTVYSAIVFYPAYECAGTAFAALFCLFFRAWQYFFVKDEPDSIICGKWDCPVLPLFYYAKKSQYHSQLYE